MVYRPTDRHTDRHTDPPTVANQYAPFFKGGIKINRKFKAYMINILLTEKCNAQRAPKIKLQLKLLQLLPNVTIHFLQSGY